MAIVDKLLHDVVQIARLLLATAHFLFIHLDFVQDMPSDSGLVIIDDKSLNSIPDAFVK